jgi:predicted dehydrogenase
MKIGLIGCGSWGRKHGQTLSVLGVLGAIADVDSARSGALASDLGCVALDIQDLIGEPSLDGIVIAVPPMVQPALALRAIAAGKNVLIEKPIALCPVEARAIETASETAGVVAMAGHLIRYHPAFEAIEALIEQGTLGEVLHIFTQRYSFGRFLDGTDAAFDLLPHDLSLVYALAGSLVGDICWQGRTVLSGLCDLGELWINFQNGMTASCSISRVSPERKRLLVVQGSKACVVFDDEKDWAAKLCLCRHDIALSDMLVSPPITIPVPLTPKNPLEAELEHFIDCITSGACPRTPVAEGREVIEFLCRLRDMKSY